MAHIEVGARSARLEIEANVLAGDAIGACVYISGVSSGGLTTARTADIADVAKMPAIGIIVAKATSTRATVLLFGVYTTSGLTPNARYFVSSAGTLTTTRPTGSVFVQPVGQAIDETRLMFSPKEMTKVLT